MHDSTVIQRALLSVYDKTNIIPLAEVLHLHGVEIISTGNTAAILKGHGIPVIAVSDYTGFPEIMDGRVKTMHPKIAGGILGRRDVDADIMLAHDIHDIDLVVVNLYPFEKVSKKPDAHVEDIIENIDIGGPTLIRAAAKNHAWCTVLVDPRDYADFMKDYEEHKGIIKEELRFRFAAKAFAHTASYDAAIANYFGQVQDKQPLDGFGQTLSLHYQLKERLRYGENPQQQAAFYLEKNAPIDSIAMTTLHQGKALSYNNIQDADCALECVKSLYESACVIVKHANPCGAALADSPLAAYQKAYQSDPTSAFGGIIAFNSAIDEKVIQAIYDNQFVEVIIAPSFSEQAILLAKQKENCRLLSYQPSSAQVVGPEIRSVNGGILIQSSANFSSKDITYRIVTQRTPNDNELNDLLFSWQLVKFVKSNAIVFAKDGQTLGIGAGQMSRIFSAHIATLKAQEVGFDLKGAVMASDAFFPFKDSIDFVKDLGVSAIIQPGGAMRDNEIIEAANQSDIAMLFTGMRCFKH